ncbi:nickel/cobalt transporter [Parvibaculum sp.]|uniref:nickel/cobalt transporter n=1 Tax=Parvibaculum sp. TaxID=2024848 RepID=UPI000C89C649|nr:nickel/cobalt transporter [Parvibaculum sp.]MAB14081.1 delayed-early response protein/equilibrative nucleoside transporter [Parvibaculum sp.]
MRHLAIALFVLSVLFAVGHATPASAESPFQAPPGAPSQSAAPAKSGTGDWFGRVTSWAIAQQQVYYRKLAGALRNFKLQGSAAATWTLVTLSFFYGIFHAVGPGHGKVVVTSYLLADERDVRRGVLLAFLAAFMQAVTAIVLVGVLALILGFTMRATANAIPYVEGASFVLIIGMGLWVIWRGLSRLRGKGHHHAHSHDHEHHHDHSHEGEACGHAHMPAPADLRKTESLAEMAGMILAVGLRPCSGAILVLLFALTQSAFLAGALSAFTMSLGTAITVSSLAVAAVSSRGVALRFASGMDNRWTRYLEVALMLLGGTIILAFGFLLLAALLTQPATPFI